MNHYSNYSRGVESTHLASYLLPLSAAYTTWGYIIAQKPLSAQERSMLLNVIKKGFVDDILNPKQMPGAIIEQMKR